MLLVAGTAVGAALLAGLRGGTLEALAATHFRWVGLVIEGLVVQAVFIAWSPPGLSNTGALWVVILSDMAIAGFLLINHKLPGMLLTIAGVGLNLAVILLNGAMPVSTDGAQTAGLEPPENGFALKHERLSDDTSLEWLGDVIPVPVVGEVWSAGDVVIALGIGRLVYVRMRPLKRRARASEASG
jgi:hypothetical protein